MFWVKYFVPDKRLAECRVSKTPAPWADGWILLFKRYPKTSQKAAFGAVLLACLPRVPWISEISGISGKHWMLVFLCCNLLNPLRGGLSNSALAGSFLRVPLWPLWLRILVL